MREPGRIAIALLLVTLVLPAIAQDGPSGEFDREYQRVVDMILCDCGCHPQSVYSCACGRAEEMRAEMAALMRPGGDGAGSAGLSADQLIARYVAEGGEQVRVAPTSSGFNLVAWVGPLVLLALAGFGMLFVLRRWGRRGDEPTEPTPTLADDDPYVERLRREMELDS